MSASKNKIFETTSFLSKSNSSYIELMYEKYSDSPNDVPESWRQYFEGINDNKDLVKKEVSGASWSPSSISYTGNNRTHMIRIPDPGRFELRLMDGSANPYLLQASVLAAGLYGLKNKVDPGKPLDCNMYEDHAKYPDLPKLPDELAQSLNLLKNNKDMNDAFGKDVINSYIKLRSSEMNEFKSKNSFDKTKDVTKWEKDNTLDC